MQPEEASPGQVKREGLEQLFQALESPLLAYAMRFAGDRSAAEDLVMEAFMRLQANFSEVREPRRWLFRAVHNLALNQNRADGRLVSLDANCGGGDMVESIDPQPLPDEQIARMEGIGLVRLTLQSLEPRSREVVRLKFQEGLSYKQISERTGLSCGNVGYLLHHALKAVADELTRNGVSE